MLAGRAIQNVYDQTYKQIRSETSIHITTSIVLSSLYVTCKRERTYKQRDRQTNVKIWVKYLIE